MKRRYLLVVFLAFALLVERSNGQKGSATPGYYPLNYGGSTFTGEITSVNGDRDELTLVYRGSKKTEEFMGRLEAPCGVPPISSKEKKRTIRAVDMSVGTRLIVYYNVVTHKEKDGKSKENVIIAIRALEVDGQKIPEDKQIISSCAKEGAFVYRFWGQER